MRITVIGVDPGLVCGMARVDLVGDDVSFQTWESARIKCCEYVARAIDDPNDTRLVVATERFTIGGGGRRPRTGQPEALLTNGALEWLTYEAACLHGRVVSFLVQGAADATRAASDDTLRLLGWWTTGDRDEHRNRAATQVALALLTLFPDRWQSLLDRAVT